MGKVTDFDEDDKVVVKFLDQRPGELFEYRSDVEAVEKKWIFHRGVDVRVAGKKAFIISKIDLLRKEYEEFKKKYKVKLKVR